jgi:hypothetical protein
MFNITQMKSIYGKEHCTMNVHLLLHVVDSVWNWGPSWTHSTIPFENGNHLLGASLNGTRWYASQLFTNINVNHLLTELLRSAHDLRFVVKLFITLLCKPSNSNVVEEMGI